MSLKKDKSITNKVFVIVVCALLAVYTISMIYPLVWGLLTSLKSNFDFSLFGNVAGFPNLNKDDVATSWNEFFKLKNYVNVFKIATVRGIANYYSGDKLINRITETNLLGLIINTLLYAGAGALLQSIVPAIVAYAVAKFDFKYGKVLFAVALFAMIMPVVGAYPSEITLLRRIGVFDTFWGYFMQKCNFMGMYFFVYHAFFKSLSDAYTEAAEIDGASHFRCLVSIILPLSIKIISTVFLIQFVHFWNDYQTPLLYMPTKPTLAYGVWFWAWNNQTLKTTPERVSASMMLAIPILIVYIFLKDKLMGNITMGGIKQ